VDEPPRGGGDVLDLTDFGAGRYRLCLTDPLVGSFEHTAWCNWTDDRSTVRDVNGLPMRIDDVAYDGWVPLDADEFQLSTTDARGRVSTYRADARNQRREVGEDGRAGHVAFAVALQLDPESNPHPGAPPGFIGAMRWTCGDPPPPR
jgi:hypothetical protein